MKVIIIIISSTIRCSSRCQSNKPHTVMTNDLKHQLILIEWKNEIESE